MCCLLRRFRDRSRESFGENSSPHLHGTQRRAISRSVELREDAAGSQLEFLGFTVSFRDDGGDVIAGSALSKGRAQKLVEFAKKLNLGGAASIATLQKFSGKLRLAQTATMGRFGRADVKPKYESIAEGAGNFPGSTKNCLK